MKKFNKEEFNNFIIENKVVGFFDEPIKLKSGRLSNWYVNWRNIAEDVFLLDKLSDYVIAFVNELNLKPKCFYGVPEGATKLSLLTQYKFAKKQKDYGKGEYPLAMGRGREKEHGEEKDRYFLGVPKGPTIVIEDVTTTGNSLIETIKILQKFNIEILAAISLTNRNELDENGKKVEDKIREFGIAYYTMSNALEILPIACKKFKLNEKAKKLLQEYFEKYGTEKLKLE
ncbi:MAG: hypothetical protein QW802_02365 [Candidatus Altiarchaeota archaeon]